MQVHLGTWLFSNRHISSGEFSNFEFQLKIILFTHRQEIVSLKLVTEPPRPIRFYGMGIFPRALLRLKHCCQDAGDINSYLRR